jgi:hypothetical protein
MESPLSSSLANSAALVKSPVFRDRVRVAMTEFAVVALGDSTGDFSVRSVRHAVARSVIADPDRLLTIFVALCADDTAISTASVADSVTEADIRRVVAARWTQVGSSIPNPGA